MSVEAPTPRAPSRSVIALSVALVVALWSINFMAVFNSAVAYLLYFWLLRYLEASQLSAFTYLLPVAATVLGILWLVERGSPLQILGGVLALAGVNWVESGRGQ